MAVHSDCCYDSAETYTKVSLSTGMVMCGNAVFYVEYGWDDMLKRYARLHREDGFVPRFLARRLWGKVSVTSGGH